MIKHNLIILMLFYGISIFAQFPPDTIWEPQAPDTLPMPGYLQTVHDADRNIDIKRISDTLAFNVPPGAGALLPQYAKIQSWNADMSKILVGFTHILNAGDYTIYKDIDNTYPGGYFNDGRWSNINPDIRYFCYGDNFLKINIETEEIDTLQNFPGYYATIGPYEGNISADDKYVVITSDTTIQGYTSSNRATLYDIELDTVLASRHFPGWGFDWASITPSGDYIAVSNYETDHTELYDLDFNFVKVLTDNTEHADFAVDSDGNEVIVQVIPLSMTRLSDNHFTDLITDASLCGWPHENPNIAGHVSGRNFGLPGWAYVSAQIQECGNGNGFYYDTEIFAVKLDGSGTIRHFGHTRSSFTSYDSYSKASVSPDGTKMIYCSDWSLYPNPDNTAYAYVSEFHVPKTYYVSTTGNNANPGTETLPWLTVQYGVDNIINGDTLIIMTGTYNEKVIVSVSGITIKNYPNQVAVLDGAGLTDSNAMVEILNQSDITIEGLEITNNVQLDAQGILISGNCQDITIKNNVIHDIHFSANPNAPVNENTNCQPLIVYGTETTAISGLLITGNEIYNCRPGFSEALSVDGNVDGFEISNNLIHDITNIGIVAAGHYQVCPDPLQDQARNGLIKNNEAFNCRSPYAASGGIYIDGGTAIAIENNISYQNDYGIEVGCEITGKSASNITVKNNLVYNNRITGIAFGGFDYPTGSGKIESCTVNNNTFFQDDSINDFNGEMLITYTENCNVFNNIFSTTSQNIAFYLAYPPVALSFDYNLYYCPGGGAALEFDWDGSTYMGLEGFQTGTGQDPHSLYENPQFVSGLLPNPDLHIQNPSMAIDNGDPAYVPSIGETDIDGEDRIAGSIVDIGADELPIGIRLEVKAFLEGPFGGTDMAQELTGSIPTNQPYNIAPWNYEGTESVDSIPENVVDWVLIELRDTTEAALATPETIIARQAAFILNDGKIVDMAGTDVLPYVSTAITNNLFVVIRHRNHLPIMSKKPVTETNGIYTYDFTTPTGQAFGNVAQQDLGNDIYGMFGGDANADNTVNDLDKTASWSNETGLSGYLSSDLNLDGQSNNIDKNKIWLLNEGEEGKVPE